MMVVCTMDPGVPGSTDRNVPVRDSKSEEKRDARQEPSRSVVISYSYTGNNDALATELAGAIGAEHRRIAERGNRSMMRIVLDVLLRRSPGVEVDLSGICATDRVILVGPVWMGKVAAPFRRLLPELGKRGSQVAYVTVCGGADGANAGLGTDLRTQLGRDDAVVIERYLADLIGREEAPTRDDTMAYRIGVDEVKQLSGEILVALEETTAKRSNV